LLIAVEGYSTPVG